MSHAYGLVKFPNGNIFFYEYNGTVDLVLPKLWKTYSELKAHWRESDPFNRECTCKNSPSKVDIYTSYGAGSNWKTVACENCLVILDTSVPDIRRRNIIPRWAQINLSFMNTTPETLQEDPKICIETTTRMSFNGIVIEYRTGPNDKSILTLFDQHQKFQLTGQESIQLFVRLIQEAVKQIHI